MADVTYNTSSFPSLLRTVDSILRLAPGCKVVLAYKERHEAERGIWGMFEGVGLKLQKIDQILGFGGAQVEVWLGGVDSVMSQRVEPIWG
jgi:protein N-lysine methyltransferase METTL21D